MKKFYVKPQAANVAFVVNENIATSQGSQTNSGLVKLDQVDSGLCFKVFYTTGIETGPDSGISDVTTSFENLDPAVINQIYTVVSNPAHPEYETYIACFVA